MISSCSLLADHGWLLRFPSFIHSYIPQSLSPHRSATCLSPSGHCAQWHSYISTLSCLSFLRSPDTCHLVKNKDPATQSLFIIPPTNTLEWTDKYSFRSDTASASVRKQTESNCFLKTKPSLSLFLSFFFHTGSTVSVSQAGWESGKRSWYSRWCCSICWTWRGKSVSCANVLFCLHCLVVGVGRREGELLSVLVAFGSLDVPFHL